MRIWILGSFLEPKCLSSSLFHEMNVSAWPSLSKTARWQLRRRQSMAKWRWGQRPSRMQVPHKNHIQFVSIFEDQQGAPICRPILRPICRPNLLDASTNFVQVVVQVFLFVIWHTFKEDKVGRKMLARLGERFDDESNKVGRRIGRESRQEIGRR